MKTAILVSVIASIGTANAAVYKCESGGKVQYQETPCDNQSQSTEIAITPIDPEKVKRAQEKLEKELKERRKLEEERAKAAKKERELRAKELRARAEQDLAYETRVQTEAINKNTKALDNNSWLRVRRKRGNRYY